MVKLSVVGVTVALTFAVCDVPPTALGVPVTVMLCAPRAMLGAVDTVSVTFCELAPLSVTLVGLNVQSAPAGKPAVQLPGIVPVEEVVEFVKLMVSVEPFTGAMVNLAVADCPAETELGARLLKTRV